jgi:DNA repair exonuclease SbcCD nuclease subunit
MSEKTKTRLRFLHCSDIHLDTPFVGLSAEKSEERRRMLRASFVKMMQYIRETNINIVLMSGDIFNTEYATNTTAEVLIREFKNCSDTEFIISPGKHDYYTDNPIYASGRLPKNCHVFSSDSLSRFDFEDYNITVYGWAFMSDSMTENPIYARQVDDSSRVNIVCAYADLNGDVYSTSCPVSVSDIKKFGADYYALGSRHEASKFLTAGASKYSYCGSLECTGFNEPGLGGVNLITIDYSDGEVAIEHKSVSFGHVRFETEQLDVTGVNTSNEIINRISRMISDKKYDNETALRVELVGYLEPHFSVPKNIENDAFGLYYFKLIDKTLPLYGTEGFKRDMSVKGEIFRQFYPMLTSEDEEERLTAASAFRIALAALENREIDF